MRNQLRTIAATAVIAVAMSVGVQTIAQQNDRNADGRGDQRKERRGDHRDDLRGYGNRTMGSGNVNRLAEFPPRAEDYRPRGMEGWRDQPGALSLRIAAADAGRGMALDRVRIHNDTDKQFGELMIAHHEAGLKMIEKYLEHGDDPKLRAFAEMKAEMGRLEVQQLRLLTDAAQ